MSTMNQAMGAHQFQVQPHIVQMDVLSAQYSATVKRKNYPRQPIYTLRNLLSPQECKGIIQAAEGIGFQEAGLAIAQDVYRKKSSTRSNERVLIEDRAMAQQLWGRMQHLVDPKFDNHVASGLNWRFRIYKYAPGDRFAPHVDERMALPNGGTTLFTFMVYLNENLTGGETTFFDRRRKGSRKLNINRVIAPKTGMALAFDHLLFHEGSVVRSGLKYVLRSDLIYVKRR